MVKLFFYEEEKELDTIPENYNEFIQLIGNLFGLQEIDIFIFEYTLNGKEYFLLNKGSYDIFYKEFQNAKVNIYTSYEETNHYKLQNEKKEEEEIKEGDNNNIKNEIKEEIKNEIKEEVVEEAYENNNINIIQEEKEEKEEKDEKEEKEEEINNDDNEIKVPEITKEMVIASIVKHQKEKIQQSRIKLEKEKKEKKEKEKKEKERKKKEKKKKEDKKPKKDFAGEISNLINSRVENFKKEIINESKIKLNEIMTESQLRIKNMNIINQKEKKINSLEEHPGITCSKCGINPIIGNRYCCLYCNNINFCNNCENEIGYEHNHPLYKFKLRLE